MRIFTKLFFCILFYGLWTMVYGLPARADTIQLKSGKEIKGIIVEDYQSRVVVSTIDGEQTVMKSEIGALHYDSEDENLVKLAERAQERRDYAQAYAYYEKALKINPKSKAAQDGMVFCHASLISKQETAKEDDVRRRAEFERSNGMVVPGASGLMEADELAAELQALLGLTLKLRDGAPMIAAIQPRSRAYEAGVRTGDGLVAVWSRLTGYMSLEDVMRILLKKQSLEMKITIERTVSVTLDRRGPFAGANDLIGARFVMKFEGLTLAQVKDGGAAALAGLRDGDLITAIDGQKTRYMPLDKAISAIRSSKGGTVRITFRRELIMWRAK